MGFFDSFVGSFNPTNWFGSKGNSMLDLMDPGNTFHQGASTRLANQQYQMEYDIAKKNLESQEYWNQKNWEAQQEAFQYQKDLNAMQMQNEKEAVQNRVADLKAAGLSPTLAAGSAASATPVRAGTAPQGTAPQMGTPSSIKVQEAMFREGLMKDRMQLATTLMGNVANIARTKAEVELLNAQTNQLNTMTPIEYRLKSQLLEFNEDFNPWRIADTIAGIEHIKADTYYKTRQSFLVDSEILLNEDEHGMNAKRLTGLILDNKLKDVRLTLDNQNYIKNAISIELLRQEYSFNEYNRKFYHQKWGVPIGFNLSPWNSYFGFKPHEEGNPYGTPDPKPDGFDPFDRTPGGWNDFVKRTFDKATNFLKETKIYNSLIRILKADAPPANPSFGGVHRFN